jgi:hypothetical protein
MVEVRASERNALARLVAGSHLPPEDRDTLQALLIRMDRARRGMG